MRTRNLHSSLFHGKQQKPTPKQPWKTTMRFGLAMAASLSSLMGCEFFGDKGEGDGGGGKSVPASMTWISTSLAKTGLAKASAADAGRADTLRVRADTGVGDTSTYLSYRITPSNIDGRLIQAALLVGEPGVGKGGSAIHLITIAENGFMGSSIDRSTELPHFNLAERLTMGESFKCCGERYPSGDAAKSGWFEIMFAYSDITFALPEGALKGEHKVRVAFADVDDLGYRRGDMLYFKDGGYVWVDSTQGAFSVTRPSKPISLPWVAQYGGSGDGRGNQHIPTLFIAVQDSQKVAMPADTVLANQWEFIADFIFENGLIFRRVDPATMTSVAQMLAAFDIRADRDNAQSGSDGISCNFYAIKTPLDMPRPDDFKDSLDQWIQPPPEE
jgi:hypothetical protein